MLASAGIKLRKCWLALINSDYVLRGAIDSQKFFKLEEITLPVSVLSREIAAQFGAMQSVIGLSEHPEIQIGRHCDQPYTCSLRERCWSFLPEANVFTLYRGGKKSLKLFAEGIHRLEKIPDDFALTANQEIQRATLRNGQPHIDQPALAVFLKQIKYPASFLDFETFNTAIPLFDEVRPFQQVPFQFWSQHLWANNWQNDYCAMELFPPFAADDATHLGFAAAHNMDYLLTWNCRDINNKALQRRIERACIACGLTCPVICTPTELMIP
ncbi:MAG: DUF2779 domain-containing protein [Verrucomicrobiota bacterium]